MAIQILDQIDVKNCGPEVAIDGVLQEVFLNQVKTSGAKESVKTISRQDEAIEKVTKEIKVYTEDEHLEKAVEEIQELYENLKSAILNLDDLEVRPKKKYIAFVAGTNVVDVHLQKKCTKDVA